MRCRGIIMQRRIVQLFLWGAMIATAWCLLNQIFQMHFTYLWDNPDGFLHEELGVSSGDRNRSTNYFDPRLILVRDFLVFSLLIVGRNIRDCRKWLILAAAFAILSLIL
jgi:hypothetical protein